jgi:hypothetical protein
MLVRSAVVAKGIKVSGKRERDSGGNYENEI